MDAKSKKLKTSGNRCFHIVTAAVAFLHALAAPTFMNNGCAQNTNIRAQDSLPPVMHHLRMEPLTLGEVRWDIRNQGFRDGCIVEWTADAFEHSELPGQTADCELTLTLIHGTRQAHWTVVNPVDRSDVAHGRDVAAVALSSRRNGNAQCGLTVRFHHPAVTELAAGRYHTTVTATITGL